MYPAIQVIKNLEQYSLGPQSFYEQPKCLEDQAVYLHLQLLAKSFGKVTINKKFHELFSIKTFEKKLAILNLNL